MLVAARDIYSDCSIAAADACKDATRYKITYIDYNLRAQVDLVPRRRTNHARAAQTRHKPCGFQLFKPHQIPWHRDIFFSSNRPRIPSGQLHTHAYIYV